jgi:uncharacterized membrane protein YraQ (UPF0718 family)
MPEPVTAHVELPTGARAAPGEGRPRPIAPAVALIVVLASVVLGRTALSSVLDRPGLRTWTTVFVAICVQALPFLVLGVTTSGLIVTFLPAGALQRLLPRRSLFSVPAAAAAGAVLPGCECSSVPVAGRLIERGAPAPAALAFLLAAPAINPVVLVATSIAFAGRPAVVLARFLASLVAAVVVGWVWARWHPVEVRTRGEASSRDHAHAGAAVRSGYPGRLATFVGAAQHDLLHAGGYLVLGAALAAGLQTVVPSSWLDSVAGAGPLSVLALAALAVIVAVCSEADAFIAASLVQFSLTARLAFMVVGPMVDVKLVAMQTGTFGRRFALRFAPLTLVVAVGAAAIVGRILL